MNEFLKHAVIWIAVIALIMTALFVVFAMLYIKCRGTGI